MEPEQNKSASSHIDLNKVLLPKKEGGPSLLSAQRVNAGALLEQEQQATLTPEQKVPEEKVTPPASEKPAELSEIKQLETYRGDIEKVIHGGDTSVVSIAAAEATRRSQRSQLATEDQPKTPKHEQDSSMLGKILMVLIGLVLIAGAAGLSAYIYLQTQTVSPSLVQNAPFVSVDETKNISISQDKFSRDTLVQEVEQARIQTNLSVGLVRRLVIEVSTPPAEPTQISGKQLMQTLAPHAPEELLRTISPTYLFGVHSFDSNQAFVVLQVDSYEVAYAAMLRFEYTMPIDLFPVFTRTPSPMVGVPSASTTQAATTTGVFVQTNFVDRIVENRDARVLQNEQGDILLLWTFLDRNTLVITTNEYTLREIIARRNSTSLVPQP